MRTCIAAKIGRNGQRCKSEGKKREMDGVFAPNDAAGWADRRRDWGVLGSAGGLARKSCGKSRISGSVFVRCSPFSGGTSRGFRDGWAMWCRFRSWPFAPQAPGGAAAEWIVVLCLLSGGSGGADDNCCAASVKATKGTTGCGGEPKNGSDSHRTVRAVGGTGDRSEAELFAASARCRMAAKVVRRRSAECCMRRRGGRALEA